MDWAFIFFMLSFIIVTCVLLLIRNHIRINVALETKKNWRKWCASTVKYSVGFCNNIDAVKTKYISKISNPDQLIGHVLPLSPACPVSVSGPAWVWAGLAEGFRLLSAALGLTPAHFTTPCPPNGWPCKLPRRWV